MDRINGSTATANRQFTEGSPTSGVPATIVSAQWLNSVQEELMGLLSAAGIAPNVSDNAQVLAAIRALVVAMFTGDNQSTGGSFRQNLPGGYMIQGGMVQNAANGPAPLTFPRAFPNAARTVLALPIYAGSTPVSAGLVDESLTRTGCQISRLTAAGATNNFSFYWLAVGN